MAETMLELPTSRLEVQCTNHQTAAPLKKVLSSRPKTKVYSWLWPQGVARAQPWGERGDLAVQEIQTGVAVCGLFSEITQYNNDIKVVTNTLI